MIAEFQDSTFSYNTWGGMKFIIRENDELIPLQGASAESTFRAESVTGEARFILTSKKSEIFIEHPGNLSILPVRIDQPPGIYYGDVKIFFADGSEATYIRIRLTLEPTTND